jgi:ribosome-associated protein
LFDVGASPSLTEAQKARVTRRAGPLLREVAEDERSQSRNRELALERLVASLRAALQVPRRRRATKPTAASNEERLRDKRHRSRLKRDRADRGEG